jgi:hypothetical protein
LSRKLIRTLLACCLILSFGLMLIGVPPRANAAFGVPRPAHVVVVIEENHSFSEIIGFASAPYINSLAQHGAVFTQSFAIEHPSLPNYLDLFSGSNQGVNNDNCPFSFSTANLGAGLISAGLTFGGFSEDLPSIGFAGCTSGSYWRKHNPWVDFDTAPNAVPTADNLPFTAWPADLNQLPTVSFVVPNQLNDMHDGTIAQGNIWLQQHLDAYVQFAKTHNSLLILTFDEDDSSLNNQITTIFVGPMVVPGQYSEHVDHFRVLRTIEDMYGLGYAGSSAATTPITDCWATPTAAPASIVGRIATADGTPLAGVVIQLSGAATRTTITDSGGNYHFDSLESGNFFTVSPSLANYAFSPANRSFSLVGNQTNAAFAAQSAIDAASNAIDTTEYFVRQQYLDFLGREPDQIGLDYWSAQINQCDGDASCVRQRRIDVSAAFFASPEFQQTGFYLDRLYEGALGRAPNYREFMADRFQLLAGAGLDQARVVLADSFVQRSEFTNRYPLSLTREQFVDEVLLTMQQHSAVGLSAQRDSLLKDYDTEGRSLVVRHAVETNAFVMAEYNRAFVRMEYFGYLRRDVDQAGNDFWLNVLEQSLPRDYRGMVCSFITAREYQRRFSSVVPDDNRECAPE